MKQFYSTLLTLRLKAALLLSLFFLSASYISHSQIYTTRLSGLNESPANNSPGTGTAKVTLVGTSMRVEANYSGLVATTSLGAPSGTTAAHIHATTAVAGTGLAGVATTTPTFTGFPQGLGVTSGTYDRTFDMTLASSYNPSFVTANGGTIPLAFAALKAALDAGKSYFNIHSTAFPGGEIRGFLVMCPTINVSIPDAFALPQGVLPNTVYPAYAPAASLTLSANVNGGTGPYTYNWSNGSTTATAMVSPTVTTQYFVTVLDQNMCPGMASKTVTVMDIAGGKKGDKINVCHKDRNTLTIGVSGVADHLGHGDMLGSCTNDPSTTTLRKIGAEQIINDLSVRALPNPSLNYFNLQINGKADNDVQLRVYDVMGRVIEARYSLQINQTLRLGSFYKPGIYLVEILQGEKRQTLRLVKEN